MDKQTETGFYEQFWQDADYQLAYAFDSAVRDRFPAIQKVWGQLRTPARVLDYGCGNGVLTFWMSAHGFGQDLLGLDVSHEGIQQAVSYFARPGLEFQVLEPGKPLDHLGVFDVVVSSHVLEHVEYPQKAIVQMLPLSEWFVLEVPLEQCFVQTALTAIRGKALGDNPVGHVNFWTKRSFDSFIASCGLISLRTYRYASAPFSPYNSSLKCALERTALKILGLGLYGRFMATHYIVLARRHPSWRERIAAIAL